MPDVFATIAEELELAAEIRAGDVRSPRLPEAGAELAELVLALEDSRAYAAASCYCARRMLTAPAVDRAGWALLLAEQVTEADGWRTARGAR